MAFIFSKTFIVLAMLLHLSSAARILPGSGKSKSDQNTMLFKYHNGPLLHGNIAVNLIWYGKFKPSQKAIITDFVDSLQSATKSPSGPSVHAWWKITEKYYTSSKTKSSSPLRLSLGKQTPDEKYSLGKTLTNQQVKLLAAKSAQSYAINVVLTSSDVAVEGFCSSKCGTHGAILPGKNNKKFAYIWLGNSETQCPGQCAWPFHQPIYGPQGLPLTAPNNDVGIDGMVINLATLLAGTTSNPFGNGFYQGPSEAPLEASSACPGIYAKGAYPGYAGNLLVDPTTGASYNAHGVNGRKYLVPALYNPSTQSCSTVA